ncbi:hypothetical protein KUTeg_014695 [Tegillarca granosa]|uniref:PLAT domain-containing protein n=1 Tax=Tegillarca granosa TaxID=220873 RepID=A0ABQ9EWL4_TEGGR|nr:hypothetical protein KUTeg_014695 [Tegillarca granosa]
MFCVVLVNNQSSIIKVRDPISYNTSSTQETISKIETFISSVIDEAELTNDAGIFIQSAETIISVSELKCMIWNSSNYNRMFRYVKEFSSTFRLVVENVTTYTVNQKPSEWNTGLLDVTDNQNLSSYQHLMDNLLRKEEDKIQMVVKEGIRNLTSRMLSKLQEGNASTYSMLELSSSAFANVISNSKFVSADSAVSTIHHQVNLVEVTVPENLNSSYYALSTTNIAVSRKLVDFEAFLIGDPAYALAEDAKITPEERTGVYRLRARIQQYEMQQKHDLAKDTTPAVIEAIGLMTSSLLDTVCKSCKDIFLTANVDTLLMKTEIKQIQAKNTLQSTEIKISFKQGSDLETTGRLSLVSFHKSPFIYGSKLEDGASVTSLVHKITLTSEEKREIATTEKISLKQPTNVVLKDYFEPTFTPGDASRMFYHVFYYRQLEDSVCFNIKPSVPVRISSYDVFIKQDTYPTHLQYDARAYVAPEKDWMTCIGPSYLSFTGKTYVGLKPTPISGINATEASLSPYNFTIVTSACKSWDNSKGLWDGSPCNMDWFPTESYIECDCSPSKEMTFANTFYVAPNTIDFSTVFLKFSPLNQAAVLATLCLILVIYILLMIWARHQDKKDQLKWGVTPLADNFVDDTYYYLLTVYTGMRSGAGTRSRIGFILSGSDGDTGIRELYDGVRREMSTGSVMYYIMAVSEPLGELDYIYIWHDNSGGGSNASWYLARIDIEDIQKKERTIFLCGKWLAVESLDGAIDAVLPACGKDNLSTFQNMFYINAKDNLSNSHMWVSIFYRPTSSVYTRVQRVSCALVFIMLTMIANALYFSPEDDYENPNLIRVGSFVFSFQEKSKPRCLDNDVREQGSKYKVPVFGDWMDTFMKDSKELEKTLVARGILDTDETILPFWCVYIAWILVAIASIIPGFFILLFSMQWGKQKSELWLSRFFLSFFESSFLLDPLKVVLMAVIFAIIFKQKEKFKPTGLDREIVLKNYRQRFGHKTGFRFPSPPLTAATIQKAREERQRDMKMMGSLKEVVVTLIFLWIIFSISYSNRDDRSYLLHRNVVKEILDPIELTKPKFTKITNTEQLIQWFNWTAFPALFPEKEYNSKQLHWRWRQYFSDLYNYRVGPPRLRQLRVRKEERNIPEFGNVVYYPNYNLLTETDENLCYSWKKPPCDLEMEAYSFSYGAWKHTSATDIWGVPVMGLYTTYGGGGYIAELDVNWSFSNRTLLELSQGLWFDRQTRAVFLEFVLYSPHLNIFTYNVFAAEFLDTGGVLPMYSIYPLRIYQHHGPTGTYMIFCEVMFILFLLLLTVRVVWRFVQVKFLYFRNPWRTLDFVCIILGYIGIAMYVGRLILANATMEKFGEDPKAFVNFQHIVFWDLLFIVLLGSLNFLATFRLLGILGYDKRIGEVFRVFSHCAYDLFWFAILFFYLFVTYALLGYLLFGQNLNSYSDIIESLSTLFISMIGKSRFTEIEESDPIMSKFYFFTFVIFLVYFMMTMFLAILCDSIDTVHKMTKKDRIPDERMTYVSLLNDLRDTIYTAFYDETKPTKPLLPPESTHKKKVRTNSTSSEKSSL